ncbi:MAG TPA: serine hydrolase [bacterium]|nr:serine hydrolase [bacterium]
MKIKSTLSRLAAAGSVLLMMLTASSSFSEEKSVPASPIKAGRTVSAVLEPEQTHAYTLTLKKDRFVYGEVDQSDVDVVVTVSGPDGKILGAFNMPARITESFQFDTETEGEYRIEIKPFEDQSGPYTITILRLEAKAADPKKRVNQLMAAYIGSGKPGAALAVLKDGKMIFAKAYGMANLTYRIPFTLETPNNIGSSSKQFTGFAVALLEKQGKLSLDDDIRKYFPELPDFGKTVTLRHLASHTSGYREYINLLAMAGRRFEEGDYIKRDEIIDIVKNQPELQNNPGDEFNYNNTGFALLAMVVERVTEQKFPEWMRDNVFGPLGMTRTVVRGNPNRIVPNSSTGYTLTREEGFREARDIFASTGAGGIYATVGDLAKWINHFKTAEAGGREVMDRMFEPFVLNSGDTTGYGLGLFIDTHRGLKRIQHGGADIAHRSMVAYYPEIDAGVITQSNNAAFSGGMADALAEIFFGEFMEPEKEKDDEPGEFNPEEYDPEEFDKLAGRYELEIAPGFILTFTREEDTFYCQATNQPRLQIVPTSDSTFKWLVVDAGITFHRNQENEVESLTLHQNGHHKARRLMEEPWKPSREEFEAYKGRYFCDELETFYTLAADDSVLVIRHRRLNDMKLVPSKKDMFNSVFPVSELVFIRDEAGRVSGFKISNGRARDVLFKKH